MVRVAVLALFAGSAVAATAATGCDSLPATSPDHINALANTGLSLSRAGQYKAAAECYRRVLAIDPKIAPIQLNLGLAEFKAGRFRDAIGPFKAAAALDPTSFQAQTMLGMAYFGARMYTEAAETLEQSVAEQPDNVQLRFNLAQSLVFSSQFERALKQFDALRQRAPMSTAIHVLLAEAYDGLQRQDEAIDELKAALAESPSEPNLHFGIGYLYWAQHRDDEAEREFQLEAKRDASNAQPLAWLGDIEIRRNNLAKARPLLEKALALDRNLRIAHLDMGIILADGRRYERAMAEFKEAIRLDPSRSDAHYRLSRVYREIGKQAEANAELAIVRQLNDKKEDSLMKVSKPAADVNAR